ncbi:MAG: ribbon-helix-helix domain-containing protein [Myxococcaceae bacterium]|nr:ribbon-helix-helix domain-containing protein [Myxococcaceae bacterium]MCI0670532.1 ribbon-helix-helix domain-containing protein [Myxococcaceae bacterium]
MDATPRLTSLVFRLNRDRLDALRSLSRTTRIRQSEYLREAIGDLLAKYEERLLSA